MTGLTAGRFLSLTAFQAEGCGGGFAADYKKAGPRPPVISTEAGQPPIGKPLIVQARGQLRLTWRLYAESPQSGEISPSDSTGSITVGDLQAQKRRFLRWTGPMGRRVLKFDGLSGRGLWWRLRRKFYNAACGGHVHIEYHNHSYHRPPLRHFVALFP